MAIPFIRDFEPRYGEAVRLSPRVRRVVADNPGPFTFYGTGVYIIGAGEAVTVIDPGPDTPNHREALWRALEGRRVDAVLLTHHHLDHTPLARPLAREHNCPVYGMSVRDSSDFETDILLDEGGDTDFLPDVEVADCDALPGGLRALHTPGHTSNHLCFALPAEDALFTGDHIMGWSTTVVVPPDGSMSDYMASLERVIAGGFSTLYPTHGAPIAEPDAFLSAYRAHRFAREAKVVAALEALGGGSVSDLVASVYADTDTALWPAASQSLLAHLIWLQNKGEARREGKVWRLASAQS